MEFTKYHVCFCDYVVSADIGGADARAVCNRHTGAGASGLVLVKENPFTARFFRADGREVLLDASALICAAAYLCEKRLTPKISVIAGGGVCEAEIMPRGEICAVLPHFDVGQVKLRRADVSPPMEYAKLGFFGARAFCPTDDIWNAVLFGLGEKMSAYRAFSGGADVDLVRLRGKDTIEVRSYERGAGYVTSGSGAVCAATAMHALGKCGADVSIAVDSGRMSVSLGDRVRLVAGAAKVMTGRI